MATSLRDAGSDLTSQSGRAAERHRRVALSAVSSGVAWATSVATTLVIIPVVLHHLGAERYGVFATITAIAGLVGWADFGLGNGLISEVAAAQGRDDSDTTARAVSTAFFALLGLAVLLGVLFAAVYPFVPWESIFNVSGDAATGVGAAAAAFAVGVLLALPLGVVQRAEIGMQEMFVASAWQALGSLLGLAGVIIAVAAGASLPYLVLAVAVAPALALAGNGGDLFLRRRPWLRPSLKRVDQDVAGALLRIGSLFFVLQIAVAVAYESDALVLTQILGPSSVTTYSITMRVFLVVPALAGFVLAPLWPAYGEAISRGDTAWVRQTLRRAVNGGLLLSISGAGPPRARRPPVHLRVGRFSSAVPAYCCCGDLGGGHDPWSCPGGVPQRCSRDSRADRARVRADGYESRTFDRVHTLDRGLRSYLGVDRRPTGMGRDRLDGSCTARPESSSGDGPAAIA